MFSLQITIEVYHTCVLNSIKVILKCLTYEFYFINSNSTIATRCRCTGLELSFKDHTEFNFVSKVLDLDKQLGFSCVGVVMVNAMLDYDVEDSF